MPFVGDEEATAAFKNRFQIPREQPVTIDDQIGAAFQLDNVVSGAVSSITTPEFGERDPAFNAVDNIRDDELPFARQLGRAGSFEEMEQIRQDIRNELKAREMLEKGPLNSFVASMIAVAGDPTSYIGFGVGAAGRAGSVASRAARVGTATAAETALQEAALQAQQETRTAAESFGAIIMGGAFGLGVGGVGAALSRRAYNRATKDFVAVMKDSFPDEMGVPTPRPAGAAAAALDPEDTLISGKAARGFAEAAARVKGVVAPNVELAASRNAATRGLMGQLFDRVFVSEGDVKFRTSGASVEAQIKRSDATRAAAFDESHRLYQKQKSGGGKLNKNDFFDEVGKALRRGDVHAVPEVQELARWYRSNVFEPWKNRAVKAGLLPDDVNVDTAVSYFTRIYNVEKINARLGEFTDLVEQYIRRTVPLEELADEAEYRELAREIINNITGSAQGRVTLGNTPLMRGPLKERTLNIPDEDIEDFLISDASQVGDRFLNTIVPDVVLTERFGRADLEDQIRKIDDDAKFRAEKAANETEAQKILNEAKREIDIVTAMVQMMRNQFDTPTSGSGIILRRVGRAIRNFNYLRLLGSVLISSIPDVGRIAMEEGLTRTFGTLFSELGNGFRGIRMGKNEAQLAGTALDVTMGTRAKAVYDLGEQYQAVSKFERGLDAAANKFGLANLLSPWNVALKSWASTVIGTRMLQAVQKVAKGTASEADIAKLSRAGIDRDMAERMAAQSEHFEKNGAVLAANSEAWTDAGAVEAFRLALLRDVDNTIITPGAADAPVWTSKEFGKAIFQFKRFAMASTGRIAAGTLQARDMAAVNGVMVMVALGGAGRAMLDIATNGEVEDRSARSWVAESLDRSGALGILTEMNAISDKAIGISPLSALQGEEASRFRSRNLLGQIGGPLAGALLDTTNAAKGAIEGEFTQSDLRKFQRLAPGQNHFLFRGLLDKLRESTGLPETR